MEQRTLEKLKKQQKEAIGRMEVDQVSKNGGTKMLGKKESYSERFP